MSARFYFKNKNNLYQMTAHTNNANILNIIIYHWQYYYHYKGSMFKGTSSVHTHTDLFIPRRHYVLHVDVTGEKRHNAVGNHRRHLQKQVAVVTNHS